MGSQTKERLLVKARNLTIPGIAAAAFLLLTGTLYAADVSSTRNITAEAGAKAVDPDRAGLSLSTPGWTDFLPLPNQAKADQKITLSYNTTLMDSRDPAFKDTLKEDVLTEEKPIESTTPPTTSILKKQEIMYPNVYGGPNTRSKQVENVVFNANLGYLVAVNVADYISTRQALQYEGLYEANPLMRPFAGNDFALAAVKVGLTAGSVFFLKSLYTKNKPLAWAATIVANLAVSYVVVNNLRAIDMVKAQQRSCGQ